jgi:signal transduction histidine kinase
MTLLGWIVALGLTLRLRRLVRRLELVARAEHELRGPLGAMGLVAGLARRDPRNARLSAALDTQLDRASAGLADLAAARSGARERPRPELVPLKRVATGAASGATVDWRAGDVAVRADRRRLAQAFGNLIQNAVEHGGGAGVAVRAERKGSRVRVEVSDSGPGFTTARPKPGRGRGLAIARAAVEEAGGHLRLIPGGRGATVTVDLPAEER